jgi:type II secretory pathway component PulJ
MMKLSEILSIITTSVAIISVIISSIYHSKKISETTGAQKERMDNLQKAIDAHDARIKTAEVSCAGNSSDIVGMRTDIWWIKQGIDELKIMLQNLGEPKRRGA